MDNWRRIWNWGVSYVVLTPMALSGYLQARLTIFMFNGSPTLGTARRLLTVSLAVPRSFYSLLILGMTVLIFASPEGAGSMVALFAITLLLGLVGGAILTNAFGKWMPVCIGAAGTPRRNWLVPNALAWGVALPTQVLAYLVVGGQIDTMPRDLLMFCLTTVSAGAVSTLVLQGIIALGIIRLRSMLVPAVSS